MSTVLRVEAFKSLAFGDGNSQWSNTYYLQIPDNPDPVNSSESIQAATDVTAFERAIHTNAVTIDRIVVSTYFEDVASETEVFRTFGVGQLGGNVVSEDDKLLTGNECLVIKFLTAGGRGSRHTYRYCLGEVDTVRSNGDISLTEPFTNSLAGLHLANFNSSPTGLLLCVPSPRAIGTAVRDVTGMQIGGISFRQRFQKKAARVSLSQRAILRRLSEMAKQLSYLNASIDAATAVGKITDSAAIAEEVQRLSGIIDEMGA